MQSAKPTTAKITTISPGQMLNLDGQTDELDVLQITRTLWRGRWSLFAYVLAASIICIVYVQYLVTPIYTAESVVVLQNRNEQIVDFENVISGLAGDQASINTEVEVLRSRGLIDILVVDLDLESDSEFNVFLEDVSPWSPGALIALIFQSNLDGDVLSAARIRAKTVDRVLESLVISNIRQSYVFQIRVRTRDAAKSARIADKLAELYILDQLNVRMQATEQATTWLSERVGQLQVELEASQNAVKTFNSSTELVSPEALDALNRQLKEFRERLSTLGLNQVKLDTSLVELEAVAQSGNAKEMVAAVDDPLLLQILAQLGSDNESDRRAFDKRFEQVVARVQQERDRNVSQQEALATSISQLEVQVSAQSADLLLLQQLEREAEASRLIYEYFLGRLKETSVQQGIQQADSRILSRAVIPEKPSSPRKAFMLALSCLAGLVLGAVIVLLREMRNNTFRTPEQMESETNLTVVGQIPRAPYARRKRILDYVVSKPTSAMAEAVRNLRTSILLSNVDQQPKVIVMSSSVPGEGKTTLSLTLSQNLASMGKKVLIIEGDLRRRTFREFFDLKGQRGILAAVSEGVPLKDVVYHYEKLDVDILIGERSGVNAADFFSSERFSKFLANARNDYDHIIIDTPPVLIVPDARVIGQLADAVIYVVHWDSTPRTQVQQGITSFNMVNVPVTGLVLSQLDPRGMKQYGYGSSYGSYSTGYYDN